MYRFVIIDGVNYTIKPDGQGEGMGGREFHIQLNSGEVIITHNLWMEFSTPTQPDNAKFIDGAGMVTLPDGTTCWSESRRGQ
jgi:hypothetical protein